VRAAAYAAASAAYASDAADDAASARRSKAQATCAEIARKHLAPTMMVAGREAD
jgi:hypothetical protein